MCLPVSFQSIIMRMYPEWGGQGRPGQGRPGQTWSGGQGRPGQTWSGGQGRPGQAWTGRTGSSRMRVDRGTTDYLNDVNEEFELAIRREQMRSGCPPRLRNLLIGLANIIVIVFIVIVINKIYTAHEKDDISSDVCFAEDM